MYPSSCNGICRMFRICLVNLQWSFSLRDKWAFAVLANYKMIEYKHAISFSSIKVLLLESCTTLTLNFLFMPH